MLKLLLEKARYGLLLAEYGGPGSLLSNARKMIYRKALAVGLEKDLGEADIEVKGDIDYSLKLATPDDMEEIVRHLRNGSGDSVPNLIQRKWFYDAGFHNCYLARTTATNEPCYMQWTISRHDENAGSAVFNSSFTYPRLGDQDVQLDDAYTFVKYRGRRIMPSVMNKLFQIARAKGYKRVVTYVDADNEASLKGCYRVGFRPFEQVERTVLLFSTRFKIIPASRSINR
jgi:ribosomal protein S18 acetylase RimI-like enzyme